MYENKIGITITATDMASAVIARSAAEIRAAVDETKDVVITSNKEMSASYRALDESVAGSSAIQDATSGAAGKLGLGSVLSSPWTAAGAAIAAATVMAVKSAGDFQAAIVRLSTSAGESVGNLNMVSSGVLEIARDTGTSTTQLTQALYMIESGGQHGANGLEVLKAAAEGALTENADLATVADAVTSAMTDYHLPASQAADVTSKLVAATGQGKTTFQDLAGAMSALLPKASAAGISLNEILGDLASMTLHGISAQQAAENMADAISHLQSPTQAMSKEMAALGLNSTELSQHLGTTGLTGTIQEISHAILNDMGSQSTAVILNMEDALKGLPSSVQDLSQQVINGSASWADWNKATKDLNVTQRSQAQAFATLYNSMHTIGTEQMTGAQVMQTYGGAMNKAMGDSAGLNVALMLTGQNSENTSKSIRAVTNASADASGNVKGWSEIQGNFNTQWHRFLEVIQTVAISLGTTLLPVLTDVFKAINDYLNVEITTFDKVRDAVKDAVSAIVSAWQSAVSVVEQAAGDIARVWDEAVATVKTAVQDIENAVKAALDVKQWGGELVDALKKAFDRAVANAPQWGRDIVHAIETGLMDLVRYDISSLINWGEQASRVAQKAMKFGEDTWHAIDNGFHQSIRDAIQWAKDLWQFISNGAVQLYHDAQQWGKDIYNNAKLGFQATVRDAMQWGRDLITNIVHGLTDGVKDIINFFKGLPATLADTVHKSGQDVAHHTVAGVSDQWHNIGELQKIGDAILKGIAIAIAAVLGAIALLAVSIVVALVNGLIGAIKRMVPAVGSFLKNTVLGAVKDAGKWLYDAGRSIIDGLIHGVKDAAGGVGNAISSVGNDIGNAVKNALHTVHVPGFASGTSYAPGGLALVGEQGPELVNLPRGSQVLNNAESMTAMSNMGTKGVIIQNLNVYNNTDVGIVTRQIGWQLANAV